jgi:hypothetical protein
MKTLLITESQKKLILLESINDEISDTVKKNYSFTKKIIKLSSEQISTNLEFLLTWGASIGGFMRPLNDFISGKYPELSDIELSLIITGVIAVYFSDNKKLMSSVNEKIKEDGLVKPFNDLLKKGGQLKKSLLAFISSLNISLHNITNIMSYCFIIPIIPILYESVSKGVISDYEIKEIALRISSFGLLTISGNIVRELVTKIVRRFSTSKN